ncbi:MAG: hypothetical protein ACT4OK_01045 [Gemmobacter sp.]
MPGLRHIQIGAFVLVAGLVVAVFAWRGGYVVGVALFAAVAIAGAVEAATGLMQWRGYRGRVRRVQVSHRARADFDLLISAMVTVAAADGHFAEGEFSMIEDVSAGLLGAPVPRARVEKARRRMQGKAPLEEIARMAQDATSEGREMAVKGAVWAGRADGALSGAETQAVEALAAALGVEGWRLQTCIAEADHVYDRLAAHEDKEGRD